MSYEEFLGSLNALVNSVNLALMAALVQALRKIGQASSGSQTTASAPPSSELAQLSVTGYSPSGGVQSRTSVWMCPLLDGTPGEVLPDGRSYWWPDGTVTALSTLPCVSRQPPELPGTCAACVVRRN